MEARARQKKPIVVEAFSSIEGLGVGQAVMSDSLGQCGEGSLGC